MYKSFRALGKRRAKKLMEAAKRNPFKSTLYHSHLISLEMYIQMFLQYQEHLSKLDERIDALEGEIEENKIIQSIPGIGEIERFNHPKTGCLQTMGFYNCKKIKALLMPSKFTTGWQLIYNNLFYGK
ncbi:hypothetical protein J7E67_14575 [Bacillus sp. ISL-46]|nr:hypothetical protein [Bacillus sp. ISL-46]